MQRDELVAIGELTGDALAGVTGQVHGIHEAVARRVWTSVGPLGTPVRIVHDAIAAGTYSAVEWSLSTAMRTGSRALGTVVPRHSPSLEQSPAARIAVGVLNGAVGDSLERRGNALGLKTTLRKRERDVELRPDVLRAEFPDATSRLAVFVHGLGETDDAWLLASERNVPYGSVCAPSSAIRLSMCATTPAARWTPAAGSSRSSCAGSARSGPSTSTRSR